MKKRLISTILVLMMIVSLVPVMSVDAGAITDTVTNGSDKRIQQMLAEIDSQNFDGTGVSSTQAMKTIKHFIFDSSFAAIGDGKYPYINGAPDYFWSVKDNVYSKKIPGSKGCMSYCYFVSMAVYNKDALNDEISPDTNSAEDLKAFLTVKAQAGEQLRIKGQNHSLAYISGDDDGFYALSYWGDNTQQIVIEYWTYKDFATYCGSRYLLILKDANKSENTGVHKEHVHSYSEVKTYVPTCISDGYTRHICGCSDYYDSDKTAKLGDKGHEYVAVVTPVSCETDGYITHTCKYCNKSYKDSIIPAKGHNYVETPVPVSCETDGYIDHVCSNCGDEYMSDFEPHPGHNMVNHECTRCHAKEQLFTDVSTDKYYWAPINWAVDNEITGGMGDGTFAPDRACTRAQIVTFIWREAGKPEPKKLSCSFKDVKSTNYYYKAVLWAVENGIVSGYDENTFAPDDSITRAQAVTFLWRAAGKQTVSQSIKFNDVKSDNYYYDAVRWAVKNDITSGYDAYHFGAYDGCTRGQIVTFLYRSN